ncbi:MAG: hypothetical protein IIY45_05015 [Firmicutes bacterium]|nr:hypothetical protein [Bacillota bacterium]
MTYVFKRSCIAAAIVLLLTGAIIVLIWYRGQGRELYIPIIGSVLMAGIGYLASRLAANILSTMENTRYLGYLHMELDPKKFLSHYEGIPEKAKGSRITARSYLADGYWADGQFAKAIETLEKDRPDDVSLMGLQSSKLSAYYLAAGDKAGARHQLERLSAVVDKTRTSNKALSNNMQDSLLLYRQYLTVLNQQAANRDYLRQAFSKAQYNIRRLEISQILAMDALRSHDTAEAGKDLQYLTEHGGKTFFTAWAKARLEDFSE